MCDCNRVLSHYHVSNRDGHRAFSSVDVDGGGGCTGDRQVPRSAENRDDFFSASVDMDAVQQTSGARDGNGRE
jgi:hypothetical protein